MKLLQTVRRKSLEITHAFVRQLRRNRARAIFWLVSARGGVAAFRLRHNWKLILVVIVILAAASFGLLLRLQPYVHAYLTGAENIQTVRTLLTTVGGALIGSAVIAFSLVMFAMQVNVERMPHGLFFRFSSDARIMLLFVGTFITALGVVACALVPRDPWSAALAMFAAWWAVVLTFLLILAAYQRALFLINPIKQLDYVAIRAMRDLAMWSRRATYAAPLLEVEKPAEERQASPRPEPDSHDLPRVRFFSMNQHWTREAGRAVTYAISYAYRYAEQGDHQVSEGALGVMAAINYAYVQAKGKTFFANNLLLDTSLATDGFINQTLEHLRQMVRRAAARHDEEQMQQALHAMANLVAIYARIDYSQRSASLTHAQLAAGYLSEAVKSVVPLNVPDVLMQGLRLMGSASLHFVAHRAPASAMGIVEAIAIVSAAGIASDKYRPATMVGLEQFAKLTLALLQTNLQNLDFPLKEIKRNVSFVAKLVLQRPDTPLASAHSQTLSAYYSGTTYEALKSWLQRLCNVVGSAAADDKNAEAVTRNMHVWAKELYMPERELLLLAIEKRSHFTFDMIHWISDTADLLLAFSNTPVCKAETARDLRMDASQMISVLSSVPDDQETTSFIANLNMTEVLFESVFNGARRSCPGFEASAQDLLLKWAFRGGRHHIGWAIMEQSVYGLAAAHLLSEPTPEKRAELLDKIRVLLARPDGPDEDMKNGTARTIRQRAEARFGHGFSLSPMEHAMDQVDADELHDLLWEIANIISPGTVGEPVLLPDFL